MRAMKQWWGIGMFAIGVMASGCATWSSSPVVPAQPAMKAGVQIPDLGGLWEYEENHLVYTLTLDANGNGTYDWQDGRFETWSVMNGVWRGVWFQPKNDREGEFALELSDDRQTATGRWWYTRIGEDTNPTSAGGTFTLRRVSPDLNGENVHSSFSPDWMDEVGEDEKFTP